MPANTIATTDRPAVQTSGGGTQGGQAIPRVRSGNSRQLYNDLGVMRAKDSISRRLRNSFKQAASWKPDLPGLDRNWVLPPIAPNFIPMLFRARTPACCRS